MFTFCKVFFDCAVQQTAHHDLPDRVRLLQCRFLSRIEFDMFCSCGSSNNAEQICPAENLTCRSNIRERWPSACQHGHYLIRSRTFFYAVSSLSYSVFGAGIRNSIHKFLSVRYQAGILKHRSYFICSLAL